MRRIDLSDEELHELRDAVAGVVFGGLDSERYLAARSLAAKVELAVAQAERHQGGGSDVTAAASTKPSG